MGSYIEQICNQWKFSDIQFDLIFSFFEKKPYFFLFKNLKFVWFFFEARMHSSRMCTVRCSGHLGGRGLPKEECLPTGRGVYSGGAMSAYGGVCQGVSAQRGVSAMGSVHLPHMNRQTHMGSVHFPMWTDRHLWKHNLSATTVADGNELNRIKENYSNEVNKTYKIISNQNIFRKTSIGNTIFEILTLKSYKK